MKKLFTTLMLCVAGYPAFAQNMSDQASWQRWGNVAVPVNDERTLIPQKETIFFINNKALKNRLFQLPTNKAQAVAINFPTPEGSTQTFMVWQENILAEPLAAKYPNIKTFSAYSLQRKGVTAKFDFTEFGFHGIVFDHSGTYYIDPYSKNANGFYSCYYKNDYAKPIGQLMHCENGDEALELPETETLKLRVNGSTKRSFRLALACTGEYAVAVDGPNPTKAGVLSAMVTSMNRVNGVYEKELAVTMNIIANNDTLIFLDGTTDPYNNASGSSMLSTNQTTITTRIGSANYDIGHVFSTGGGGIASLGSVCRTNSKARGVTGQPNPLGDPFDIDYVAHEMGHQFGAEHTFNASSGSCAGNGEDLTAYEPGSGSTIMAYAGICGAANNLQKNSDAYFHAVSLSQMSAFLTANNGATCAATSASLNTPPMVDSFTATYSIPQLTPFELSAPNVTDNDADTILYCWEQWNRGNFGTNWSAASTRGPIFRSYPPNGSPTRVFPRLDTLVDGVTSYLGERLPDVDRFLTFKLTVRDFFNGVGSFNFPNDTVRLEVVAAAGPFTVTAPAAAVNWLGSTPEIVTWNVAGTDLAPISCSNVDILLSIDGGFTYPYILAANTPNDGMDTVSVPNGISTTTARIKVKAANNVFFNISAGDFIITNNTGLPNVGWSNGLSIFPVPATDMLHIMSLMNTDMDVHITNAVGQEVYRGTLGKKLDIPVSNWSRGVYYVQLVNTENGAKTIRPIVVK